MKKLMVVLVVGLLLSTAFSPCVMAAQGQGRGGVMGFIAGCCFGVRGGAAYNDGKEIHWREWCRLIPYVNIVFAIWDGIDGVNGTTSADYAQKYGSTYY